MDNLGVLLVNGLFVLAPVLAAVLVGLLTRGRTRALGIAGFGLLAFEGLLNVIWLFVFPQLVRSGDTFRLLTTAYSALRGVLTLVTIALLALAVIVDRARPTQTPEGSYPPSRPRT